LTKTGETDIVADNVSFTPPNLITCDIDLLGGVAGKWDVVVTNGCCTEETITEGFEILEYAYFNTFDTGASDWTKSPGSYWACNWFNNEICDSNASCTTYGDGPSYYAWNVTAITIPDCWPSTPTMELHINHSSVKQEYYYDCSQVQWSTSSSSGPWSTLTFYDHPYAWHGAWERSWPTRDAHAYLPGLAPGGSVWFRFRSFTRDWIANSGKGWTIYYMDIS
jgi:hypothetical protein